MCGIFGFVGIPDKEKLKKIALLAGERGFNSFGISYYPDRDDYQNSKIVTKKYPGKISDNLDKILKVKTCIMIGQARLSTSSESTLENSAPFAVEDVAIVHNGNIYNYKEIAEKYNYKMISDTDSEVIIPMFLNNADFKKEITSTFAIAILHNKKIIIQNRKLPIYYTRERGCFYFCSKQFPYSTKLTNTKKLYV